MALINDRRRRGGGFSPAALDGLLLAMTADPGYVFQDSAGTTAAVSHGDSVGLTPHRFGGSLDLSQSTDAERPTLDIALGNGRGPEMVDNGDFSDGADNWTLGAGWSASGGRATHAGSGGDIRQSITGLTVGATYEFRSLLDASGDTFLSNTAVQIRNSANTTSIVQALSGDLTPDAENSVLLTFVATESTHIVRCFSEDNVSWGNITVREVLRDGPRGIRFNGTDQFLDATGLTAASGPKTVIAGCITDDGESGGSNYALDVETGRQISDLTGGSGTGAARMFDGNWTSGGDYDTEALAVLTFKHYATGGGIRANGIEIVTENVTERSYGGAVSVGSNFSGVNQFLNGVIHALLVFDRALTDKEIQLCEAWVAARQGRIL